MWLLKVKLKHDCIIGNRCKKYNIISHSMSLNHWNYKEYNYTSEMHILEGDQKAINAFLKDIKKDKRINYIEIDNKSIFYIGKEKGKKPSYFYSTNMFFIKPIFVDKQGYETWEIICYNKTILSDFYNNLKKQRYEYLELLKLKNIGLKSIYFPIIGSDLTEKQNKVFKSAIKHGYYDYPKKTDLKKLSKGLNISLSTFQEHLKKAESKIIPKLRYIKD